MLRASYLLGIATLALSALAMGASAAGCGDDAALKAPRSDTQYDDPDDPGTGGVVGAVDASTRDAGPFDAAVADDGGAGDAAGDAADAGG